MVKKHILSLFALLTLLGTTSDAQSLLGLRFPQGLPLQEGSGAALSFAGTGVGVENDLLGMSKNPANLGTTNRAVFSSLIAAELLRIDDGGKNNTDHLDMSLRLLSLSIPTGKYGTIGFSMSPRSNTALRYRLTNTVKTSAIANQPQIDTVELGLIKSGGTIAWQAGWGINIKNRLRLGIAYERLYLSSRTITSTATYGSISGILVDSSRTLASTNGIRGGVLFPIRNLTLGFTGEYFFTGSATEKSRTRGTRDSLVLTSSKTFEQQPAPSATVGASYRFNHQWLAAFDAGGTLWDRYYSADKPVIGVDNAYFISCGAQFIPAPNLLTPKYYEIMQYRAGVRYTQLPTADAREFAVTAATGLPLQAGGGILDVILSFGRRWDKAFSKYAENSFSVQIGINGGRKWYQSSDESY